MDSKLQHKLFHFEAQPDNKVWQEIVTALDENNDVVAEKLLNYEAQPSTDIWNKISLKLNEEVKEKAIVIPFYKRYSRYLKYGSAVAVLAFLAIVTTLLFNKETESGSLAGTPVPPITDQPKTEKIINSTDTIKEDEPVITIENTVQPPEKDVYFSPNNYSVTVASSVKKRNPVIETPQLNPINAEHSLTASASLASYNASVVNNSLLDKYIVVENENGNAVKLPKKIYDKVNCTEEIFAYEKACKEALAKLQHKMSMQVADTDFTGLLQMLKNLQENQ